MAQATLEVQVPQSPGPERGDVGPGGSQGSMVWKQWTDGRCV